ncbi:MAG: phosphoglucosamine mutase [Acidimicrobiia bacterium]|nr:phosphoglucosamine mutase [Acidimicrobiia bacterium]
MSLRFGTDGVRGVANRDLTPELVLALGRAVVRALGADRPLLVASDTRRSGPMLEAALTAGVCGEGGTVVSLGVLPTPGLAHASRESDAPAAMISASHNPFADNGIKIFAAGGRKLPDELERRIETELVTVLGRAVDEQEPVGAAVGTSLAGPDAARQYVDHLVETLEGRRFDGRRVVLDCGNGAASRTAPAVFERLGADVSTIGVDPDGLNINDGCGSTAPEQLQRAVVENRADAGFAFDGDADRCVAVDENGALRDGDHILAITAFDLAARDALPGRAIATTVMANLGLRRALAAEGITIVETPVGDRHVLSAMEDQGLALGGEQSGHVIFSEHASTGDGTLTALMLLDVVCRSGRSLGDLADVVVKLPQILTNVAVESTEDLDVSEGFWNDVHVAEAELADDGRILVRASGTEPVVRIMVEATEIDVANAVARRLESSLAAHLRISEVAQGEEQGES